MENVGKYIESERARGKLLIGSRTAKVWVIACAA